jgi:hypothetical protein
MRFRSLRALSCLLPFAIAHCSSDSRTAAAPIMGGAGTAGSSRGIGTGGMVAAVAGGSAASAGRGGSTASGGSGGSAAGGSGGSSDGTGSLPAGAGGSSAGAGGSSSMSTELADFSFFVTSLEAMRRLSKSQNGFGGDLRYGEADGLSGADKICTEIAEASMPGASAKGWRALLSVNQGPSGQPVHALDRIGSGPWYDRLGRIFAMTRDELLSERPQGADEEIRDDLPNEFGVPNHKPDPTGEALDNHHVLTGSSPEGYVQGPTSTCDDWTTTDPDAGRPRVGFSWPANGRPGHWLSGQDEGGCGAGVLLEEMGGSNPNNPIVGSGGGYGAIYCFALMP